MCVLCNRRTSDDMCDRCLDKMANEMALEFDDYESMKESTIDKELRYVQYSFPW